MIEGASVRLRAPEKADLPYFLKWINDPEVTAYLPVGALVSPEEEEAWLRGVMSSSSERTFSIETKDGRLIGNCALREIDWTHRRADVGIMIGEKGAWSRGYGTDALAVLLGLAFGEMGLNRASLTAAADNLRAIRAYEKCGFRREGVLRSYLYKNGQYIDCVQMSLLKDEWNGLPAGRRP
ncbi:GNAT family N-acetyltransferase [Methanomassiliicoccus luminyensis]|uniref:GNAT family N-acetyltransferase n=1 Tax=Methanomassiliicoccus luminyensis TaxID=1080712 RepID=UPI0003710A2B|nr:GNAT family protein [Methanomassiliicoccus luminyensis]